MSAEPEGTTRSRRRLAWPLVTLGLIALAVIVFVLVSPRRDVRDRVAIG